MSIPGNIILDFGCWAFLPIGLTEWQCSGWFLHWSSLVSCSDVRKNGAIHFLEEEQFHSQCKWEHEAWFECGVPMNGGIHGTLVHFALTGGHCQYYSYFSWIIQGNYIFNGFWCLHCLRKRSDMKRPCIIHWMNE